MSKQLARSRGGISMTDGSLWKNIFLFSVPLIFSQLLQVMFNMADVAVVGKFANATALGSVGSTTTLVTLFTVLEAASMSVWRSTSARVRTRIQRMRFIPRC